MKNKRLVIRVSWLPVGRRRPTIGEEILRNKAEVLKCLDPPKD